MLTGLTSAQLSHLQILTDHASVILWLTGGDLLRAERPNFSPVFGLSRAVMLEQPILKFAVLDIDDFSKHYDVTVANIASILAEVSANSKPDLAFIQRDGMVHVSRFVSDENVNEDFMAKLDGALASTQLKDAGYCQLSTKQAGQTDSLHFLQKPKTTQSLKPEWLEIDVKFIPMNAKVWADSQILQPLRLMNE